MSIGFDGFTMLPHRSVSLLLLLHVDELAIVRFIGMKCVIMRASTVHIASTEYFVCECTFFRLFANRIQTATQQCNDEGLCC